MADKTNPPVPTELIPSIEGRLSALASAGAPVLFFDGCPTMGFYGGIAHISLSAMRFTPREDGTGGPVLVDNMFVAHVRTNMAGLASLKEAIAKIELLAAPVDEKSKN